MGHGRRGPTDTVGNLFDGLPRIIEGDRGSDPIGMGNDFLYVLVHIMGRVRVSGETDVTQNFNDIL